MTFARAWAHIAEVAILTDPGGSVLRSSPAVGRRSRKRCDPHRPRRVGAATNGAVPVFRESARLRSSPTPEGRCCPTVKCQTSPPTNSCDPHRPRRVGAARVGARVVGGGGALVAILTDPGGSVLPGSTPPSPKTPTGLRSSPTPEGRCCAVNDPLSDPLTPWLRSSPTPEGRCCKSALTPS